MEKYETECSPENPGVRAAIFLARVSLSMLTSSFRGRRWTLKMEARPLMSGGPEVVEHRLVTSGFFRTVSEMSPHSRDGEVTCDEQTDRTNPRACFTRFSTSTRDFFVHIIFSHVNLTHLTNKNNNHTHNPWTSMWQIYELFNLRGPEGQICDWAPAKLIL